MPSEVSGAFVWPRSLDLARLEDPHWIRAWHAILRFLRRKQGAENSSTTGLSFSYLETSILPAETMETSMPSFFFSWRVSGRDLSLCHHQDDDFLVWLSGVSNALAHLEPKGTNQRRFFAEIFNADELSKKYKIARPQDHGTSSFLLSSLA